MNYLLLIPLTLFIIVITGLLKVIKEQKRFEREYYNNHIEHNSVGNNNS